MSWTVHLPMRDRAEPLDADALCDLPQALPAGDDREIARELLLQARLDGFPNVGAVHDRLASISSAERRRWLDSCRRRLGLPTTQEADERARFEALQRSLPPPDTGRDHLGRVQGICSASGCKRFQPDPVTGGIAMLPVRRWWCAEHRDQAGPDDHEPYTGPRLGYSASGAIIDLDEQGAERARDAERQRSRRAELEARRAERQAEGEQLLARERAERQQVPHNLRAGP